ncbi:family 43 glycosylhydrolase [Ectobacillus ponti]|uniref:Endo-alpha-(1->5)-L-arabinanase n=1 Tax=Ectobacillus ponti TaxID=2961894 RepID=A0AA42BQ15_9BACI|nr:family 43 glycosylhydrolase [Ectobacillus ponti]MCP8967959.1 family 43 glycosylhydrolase [Ectobacillus ponti]
MKKKTIILTAAAAILAASAAFGMTWLQKPKETAATPKFGEYQNPVFEPVFADPSVIKGEDGYYYAYGTEDDWGDGHGPHVVPILRSKNLVDWKFHRDAFEVKPGWKEGGGGLWAPDISKHKDGKYYMYYSVSIWGDPNPAIGVATADSPGGPFTDQGQLFTSDSIGVDNSIDPQFFQDDDGKSYLFWGSFHGIYGIELSADGLKTVGEKFQVADTQYEAPYVIKRDGKYYFFGSAGSCCDGENSTYHVNVGRSDSIKEPFKDAKGVSLLQGGGTTVLAFNEKKGKNGKQFVGPGHNAIVTDAAGKDWILYHAIDADDPRLLNGATRRPLLIDAITWEKGWPTVKGKEPGNGPAPAPAVK